MINYYCDLNTSDRVICTMPENVNNGTTMNPILFNPILAYIKSMMSNFDADHIERIIISSFDVAAIKSAREMLFHHSDPDKPYTYRGPNANPNQPTERAKAVHAFKGLFSQLQELDRNDKLPILACLSDDLHFLLRGKATSCNHSYCDEKFTHMQAQLDEIKRTFHTYTSIVSRPDPIPSAISTPMRERLGSAKRKISPEEVLDASPPPNSEHEDDSEGFTYQRGYRKKLAKKARHGAAEDIADSSDSPFTRPPQKNRPEAVWGKDTANSSGFRGVPPRSQHVPQAFIFRCDRTVTTEAKVQAHLVNQGIKVLEVKLASHEQAVWKSFVVTVEKQEDYDKLLSGNYVPQYVCVRRYFPPRGDRMQPNVARDTRVWQYQRGIQELDALPLSVRTSTPPTDVPSAPVQISAESLQPVQISSESDHPVQNTAALVKAVVSASALQTPSQLDSDASSRTATS